MRPKTSQSEEYQLELGEVLFWSELPKNYDFLVVYLKKVFTLSFHYAMI